MDAASGKCCESRGVSDFCPFSKNGIYDEGKNAFRTDWENSEFLLLSQPVPIITVPALAPLKEARTGRVKGSRKFTCCHQRCWQQYFWGSAMRRNHMWKNNHPYLWPVNPILGVTQWNWLAEDSRRRQECPSSDSPQWIYGLYGDDCLATDTDSSKEGLDTFMKRGLSAMTAKWSRHFQGHVSLQTIVDLLLLMGEVSWHFLLHVSLP